MAGEDSIVSGMAGRYANALFELAKDENKLDAVATDLGAFSGLLDESEDLRRLVRSPVFSADEQSRAIAAVLDKAGISGLTANFFRLVAKNRRLFALTDMIHAFRALHAAFRGEMTAQVTSATSLSDEQQEALKAAIKAAMGKDVRISARVDESLLGGLIVKVGSRMIDSSLRTKLTNLKIAMKEVG